MRNPNVLNIHPKAGQGVYVYGLPVRLWHWTIVCCILTLFVTGYLIGKPPHSLTGDATYVLNFGYVVMAHFTAGLILCVAMLCRIIWAFFGNPISRQIFIPKVWQKSWWQGLWETILWYLFINKHPKIYMGHNPLAQIAMWAVVMTIIFMSLSGLGIYQAKGYSSFFHIFSFMENWTYDLGGNLFNLVLCHRLGMIIVVVFLICHFYMVVREDIMGRTTVLSTMVNGIRLVKATPMQDLMDLEKEEHRIDYAPDCSTSHTGKISDSLYEDAKAYVLQQGFGSITLLEKHFKIGFNAAMRIMERMEKEDMFTPADGSNPRTVIRTLKIKD